MHHTLSLPESWQPYLASELQQPYMQQLFTFLDGCDPRNIYPAKAQWFTALQRTAFDDVKVVILGQDPYHGPGQAHGLSFSVPAGEKIPPSLRNIYKELAADPDINFTIPQHGCLHDWADQGVLLLNATLTVAAGQAGSHQQRGWEQFTDAIIRQLNAHKQHLVFMLWGNYARQKGSRIDSSRHCILQSSHPSPLSAHRGFLGCRHFSQANNWLQAHGQAAIDWQLPASASDPTDKQCSLDFRLQRA